MRWAFKQWLTRLLARIQGPAKARPTRLLPSRQPPLVSLRPGRQHCQIHDGEYLQAILSVELTDTSQPEHNTSPQPPSAHNG